ncbi:MAG TPA: VIT domain-containing protein, partial [Planctomycetota bacterium]|nr:VIT domain-containing protein [Planctomycetota bacterium]
MIAAAVPMSESLAADRTRGLGRLCVVRDERRAALPLAGVAIRARVADRVAHVTMAQTFQNPYPEALEAVYIFPLAGGSAVSAFELKVGDRVIKGVVKERGQARADYQQAVQQGKRAALLEQDRDDVFTVQVGNLPPGESVSVRITYSERLPFFDDGSTEIRLPLVVAPRYIPGKPLDRASVGDGTIDDTDSVPDASRITPPRLAPGFDPKVALSLEVSLEDDRLDDLSCSQHAVQLKKGVVALARQDELLDRDFVLRWRPSGDTLTTSLLATRDGYGLLSLLPPKRDGYLGLPRDVIFVLDRSGSMGGVKMSSAARACSLLLDTLGPRDRFDIVAFDDSTEWFDGFTTADEAGRERGHAFLRTIDARGGTELDPAMKETLERFGKVEGRAKAVVVITDGQVGNESAVLKRVQKDGGDLRLFTLGIDTAVNAGFLKRLAALGGGTSTFVEPGAALDDALVAVGREIGAPLVVDLAIAGAEAASRIPDLFAGRAASVFLRVKPGATVTVKGRYADGKPFSAKVKAKAVDLPAIAHLWARAKVADLEDRYRLEPQNQAKIQKEIVRLAVDHTLLTRFTAFVVVDESEIVNPQGQGRTVVQPVHVPSKWELQEEEFEKCGDMAASGIAAGSAAPSPCMAPPPPPAPRGQAMAKKCRMAPPKEECDEGAPAPEPKATPAQEKAVAKAVEALRQALEAARKAVAEGRR